MSTTSSEQHIRSRPRRLVSPVAEQHGFAIDEVADIDGFVPRFREQALAVNALIAMPPMITAWAEVRK